MITIIIWPVPKIELEQNSCILFLVTFINELKVANYKKKVKAINNNSIKNQSLGSKFD